MNSDLTGVVNMIQIQSWHEELTWRVNMKSYYLSLDLKQNQGINNSESIWET